MPIPVVDLGPILANSATGPALLNNQLGPSALPLALFPVRLETRFFGNELRVRIYPDKIHIDSHDPKLNADEVAWGERFWQLQWADASKQHDAWRMLADRFGAERGAWIARALTPTNLPIRPAGAPKISRSRCPCQGDANSESPPVSGSMGCDRVHEWSGRRGRAGKRHQEGSGDRS